MKHLLFMPLLLAAATSSGGSPSGTRAAFTVSSFVDHHLQTLCIQGPVQEGGTKMRAAVFKAQEYCRAELKDFEFDVQYKVVSAVVYFSGANFKNAEKGTISGSSLQPVKSQMNRCGPGTIVLFDEVKVMGPDNLVRTIPGISLILI